MKGQWVRDVMSCSRGLWAFPSGEVYVGGFRNNARQGENGWIWMPDSSVFVGAWDNDAPSGEGVFYVKNIHDPILRHLTNYAIQEKNVVRNEKLHSHGDAERIEAVATPL